GHVLEHRLLGRVGADLAEGPGAAGRHLLAAPHVAGPGGHPGTTGAGGAGGPGRAAHRGRAQFARPPGDRVHRRACLPRGSGLRREAARAARAGRLGGVLSAAGAGVSRSGAASATIPGLPRHPGDWATPEDTMVKIRLTRGGAKKRPFYHIIVTDSRSARDGRNIERLGYYNPVAQGAEQRVVLDTARVDHWVSQGAQLTDKVRDLYKEAAKAAAAAAA